MHRRRILLSETEQVVSLAEALRLTNVASGNEIGERKVALAIGPEGGWTAEEMLLFREREWTPVTLGPRILRAETAAIAAIAITGSLVG